MFFLRCNTSDQLLYEIGTFDDEIVVPFAAFTKCIQRYYYIRQNGCFIQTSAKDLHSRFFSVKFVPQLNLKCCLLCGGG